MKYEIELPEDCTWHPSPYARGVNTEQPRKVNILQYPADKMGITYEIPLGVAALLDYALQQREMWEKMAHNYEGVIERMTKAHGERLRDLRIWEQNGFDPFKRSEEKKHEHTLWNLSDSKKEDVEAALVYYKSVYQPELQPMGGLHENLRRWIVGLEAHLRSMNSR